MVAMLPASVWTCGALTNRAVVLDPDRLID